VWWLFFVRREARRQSTYICNVALLTFGEAPWQDTLTGVILDPLAA
jgi:hypothetical protein